MHAQLAPLAAKLSQIAGTPVELSFTGPASFTVLAEGNHEEGLNTVRSYLITGGASCDEMAEYDEECGFTALWFYTVN